ncbi:MAG: rod-binding protein [Gemmatimonadota bacterium]
MTGIMPTGGRNPTPNADGTLSKAAQLERLRTASHRLEGLFVSKLFEAMRATVPHEGLVEDVPGQDTFTAMLDERMAEITANHSRNGVGESLYRQLSRRLDAVQAASQNPTTAADSALRQASEIPGDPIPKAADMPDPMLKS